MKRIISTIMLVCAVAAASYGQNTLRGAYFLDGYNAVYKLNPALHGDRNFLAIPALSNVNAMAESNVGISTFLFPDGNGNLNTFLSESVTADEFLANIKDRNLLGVGENITLLGLGFGKDNKYNTFDISLKTEADLNLPGDLFRFMKNGSNEVALTDMGVRANSFVEIGYGLSQKMTQRLTIGMRVKALVGLGSAEAQFRDATFTMNEDKWTASGDGFLQTAGAIYFESTSDSKVNFDEGVKFRQENLLSSFGAAIDFGFEYRIGKLLTLTGAVTDLGMMKWGNITYAETSGDTWEFDGFGEISKDTSMDDQIDQIGKDLADCFAVYVKDGLKTGMSSLSPTFMAGLEVTPGVNGRFSTGLLATYHMDGAYSWYEGRVSTNFALAKCFSCSLSGATSTFGFSGGFALNLHAPGINLFVGTDNIIPWTRMSNYYVPVTDLNTNLTVGLNILFGKYNGKLRI